MTIKATQRFPLDNLLECGRCGGPLHLEIWPESGGSRVSGYTWSQQA